METTKEKFVLYAFCISLIIISVFPSLFKTLFVHQSGKFEAIGIAWAVIIIAAIVKKWKHTKLLFNIVFITTLLFEILIIFMSSQPYSLHFALLMLSQIILLLIFNFSTVMQNYFHNNVSI